MKIYIMPRGSGKTMYMIRQSAKTGHTIVCFNRQTARSLVLSAESLGLKIQQPITYDDFINNSWRGRKISGFLIDDAQWLLQNIAGQTPVVAVTMTEE